MTITTAPAEITEAIRADLADVATPSLTLGDLIRAGSAHTVKVGDWGHGDQACALGAAAVAAESLGLFE